MNSTEFKKICISLCNKLVKLEETKCVVCFDKINVGTLLLPCSHYQICFKCSTEIENCPLCRTKIKHLINYCDKTESESIEKFCNAIGGF